MTTDDIIKLAREAGAYVYTNAMVPNSLPEISFVPLSLERFAALVRTAVLEEAAGVCDEQAHDWHLHAKGGPVSAYNACAAAIRQLKDKT